MVGTGAPGWRYFIGSEIIRQALNTDQQLSLNSITGRASEVDQRERSSLIVEVRSADLDEALCPVESPRGRILFVDIKPERLVPSGYVVQQGGPDAAAVLPRIDEEHVSLAVVLGDEADHLPPLHSHPEVLHERQIAGYGGLVPIDIGWCQEVMTRLHGSTLDLEEPTMIVVVCRSDLDGHERSLSRACLTGFTSAQHRHPVRRSTVVERSV